MTARTTAAARRRPRRWGTVNDAADYLGLSTRTIRRWIADGVIAAYRVGPAMIRIDLNELDELPQRVAAAGGGS
jgi:excisionase family DNA binding protein